MRFERLMPALDFALRLGMAGRTPDMGHAPSLEPLGQIACNIGRAVVGEQTRPLHDLHLIEPRSYQSPIERLAGCIVLHSFQATM